jgi:hypothetical protein
VSGVHHYDHYPSRDEFQQRIGEAATPKTAKTAALVAAVLGMGLFAFGAFTGEERAWQALHINWLFLATISTAGVAFAGVQRIVTARWSRPILRFFEGYVAFLPVAFILLLLILFPGREAIFTWAAREEIEIAEKAQYLQPGWFVFRGVFFFGAMTLLSLWFVYKSVRLDVAVLPNFTGAKWAEGLRQRMRQGFGEERRELHSTHSILGKVGVAVCMAFVIGWCFLAWDYSMTISLHYQQTMHAWIVFMCGWLGMMMSASLLSMWWRKQMQVDDLVTINHFWDLGKLCFAFTAFFGYISFAQYLVVWYANIPEETHFYRLRLMEPWVNITQLIPILAFVVPFFGLISKAAKVYLPTFVLFASASLVGTWMHRYIEVYPSIYGEIASGLPLGLYELGVAVGMIGLWFTCYFAFMDAFPKMRVFMMTSPYRDEVQVPCDPKTMEPLPAHE